MNKDRWLKAAYRDDHMVADFLLRLRQPSSSTTSSLHQPYPPPPPPFQPLLPPLAWGQKQPRSTPLRKYSAASTRCSPRTPLSWSGGAATASPSDGGYDEASVGCPTPDPLASSRSKNFSQLSEEETELMKGRVNLKKNLESMHVNLKEQRNRSGNLKRIKLDLNEQSTEAGALSTQPEALFPNHPSQMEVSTASLHQSILLRHSIKDECASANSCGMQKVAETNKRGFVVPDLNMPLGDDEIAAELW